MEKGSMSILLVPHRTNTLVGGIHSSTKPLFGHLHCTCSSTFVSWQRTCSLSRVKSRRTCRYIEKNNKTYSIQYIKFYTGIYIYCGLASQPKPSLGKLELGSFGILVKHPSLSSFVHIMNRAIFEPSLERLSSFAALVTSCLLELLEEYFRILMQNESSWMCTRYKFSVWMHWMEHRLMPFLRI